MQIFSVILVVFGILLVALASDVRKVDFSDPAHPGKCVINKDLILDPGHHKHPTDRCLSYECEESGMATMFTSSPEGCTDPLPTPTPPPVAIA